MSVTKVDFPARVLLAPSLALPRHQAWRLVHQERGGRTMDPRAQREPRHQRLRAELFTHRLRLFSNAAPRPWQSSQKAGCQIRLKIFGFINSILLPHVQLFRQNYVSLTFHFSLTSFFFRSIFYALPSLAHSHPFLLPPSPPHLTRDQSKPFGIVRHSPPGAMSSWKWRDARFF